MLKITRPSSALAKAGFSGWVAGDRPRLVLYPILLALAWVLNQALSTEAEWRAMVRPALVAAALAALLMAVGWIALRNRWDGAMLATFLILVVLLPFPAFKLWQALGPTLGFVAMTAALTALVGIPAVLVARARRLGRPMPKPRTSFLNGFAALLLPVNLITNGLGDAHRAVDQWFATPEAAVVSASHVDPPDIVVIMLDGYARSDVLARRLGIDNSAFLADLEQRGFDVASHSRSNYVFTALTLASMFQMRYLDQVEGIQSLIGSTEPMHDALRDAATDGVAFRALKAAGYTVVTAPPGWEHVSLATVSDRTLDGGQMTDLERSLLEQTWVQDVLTIADPAAITRQLRDRLVYGFDALDEFAGDERTDPTFLFLHVPGPHPPLVVDAGGATVPLAARMLSADGPDELQMTEAQYSATWAAELDYLQKRVIQGIDRLQRSDDSTVIVVMADHGYVQDVRREDSEARFANLFAAYTPGAPGLLQDAPTLVNLFPRLLNEYLGTEFPLRPDRFFLSPGPLNPLVLTEVAESTAEP